MAIMAVIFIVSIMFSTIDHNTEGDMQQDLSNIHPIANQFPTNAAFSCSHCKLQESCCCCCCQVLRVTNAINVITLVATKKKMKITTTSAAPNIAANEVCAGGLL